LTFLALLMIFMIGTNIDAQIGHLDKPITANGITLGDSYDKVLKTLGKPLKETLHFEKDVPVSDTEWTRLLEYEGGSIELAAGLMPVSQRLS
jgi:hypothetical protein